MDIAILNEARPEHKLIFKRINTSTEKENLRVQITPFDKQAQIHIRQNLSCSMTNLFYQKHRQ